MYTSGRYFMTKYYYTCEDDKKLIERSFRNIASVIFGKKKADKIITFREFWEQMVSNVNVFPQDILQDRINHKNSEICRFDDKIQKIIIEMFGYKGTNSRQSSWI